MTCFVSRKRFEAGVGAHRIIFGLAWLLFLAVVVPGSRAEACFCVSRATNAEIVRAAPAVLIVRAKRAVLTMQALQTLNTFSLRFQALDRPVDSSSVGLAGWVKDNFVQWSRHSRSGGTTTFDDIAFTRDTRLSVDPIQVSVIEFDVVERVAGDWQASSVYLVGELRPGHFPRGIRRDGSQAPGLPAGCYYFNYKLGALYALVLGPDGGLEHGCAAWTNLMVLSTRDPWIEQLRAWRAPGADRPHWMRPGY